MPAGHYIVTGVKGERYGIEPAVFAEYEPVEGRPGYYVNPLTGPPVMAFQLAFPIDVYRPDWEHGGKAGDWFWDLDQAGGGAIVDLGCHCIEIIRNFIGKEIRPAEVMCWADTLVHPIDAEDNGIGLIRFANGAMGQFEVSWSFRGGMDLRDEVAGTEGTIWLNHFLRTGFEMFTSGRGGYVAEKADQETGWLFPVGDEVTELGYTDMFTDMFESMDEGREPMETFYDGYVVNAIIDACYRSAKTKRWEPVELEAWRGADTVEQIKGFKLDYDGHQLVKRERMPDGTVKLILRDKETGEISQRFVEEG